MSLLPQEETYCRSKRPNARNSRSTSHQHTYLLTDDSTKKPVESSDEYSHTLFQLGSSSSSPVMVEIQVNQKPLQMQIDTGVSVSIISYTIYSSIWDNPPTLNSSQAKIRTYTGEEIEVLGRITPQVSYKGKERNCLCSLLKVMDLLSSVVTGYSTSYLTGKKLTTFSQYIRKYTLYSISIPMFFVQN